MAEPFTSETEHTDALHAAVPASQTRPASTQTESAGTLPKFDGLWQRVTVTADDGARLATYVHEPTSGHTDLTFILAHGWTLTHRSWHKVANQLVAQDTARVIVWDQRGHGDSTLENGKIFTGDQSMARLADDIAAIINELAPAPRSVVLAGHSLGGMAVIEFATRHRDLLAARVRGVALVDTSARDIAAVRIPGGTPLLKLADVLPIRPGRLVPAPLEKWLAFGEGASDEDARDIAAQTGSTRLSTTGAFYEVVRDLDLVDALDALAGTPVRVVVGEKDQLTPVSHSQLIADRVPTSQLHIVPGAGHLTLYERPDEVVTQLVELAAE